MKRILFIIMAIAAVNTGWSQQKIGHIDSQQLLEMMPGREAKMAEYEKFRKELDDLLVSMQEDYQTMIEEYQTAGQSWPKSYAQTKLEAIASQERQITNFQEQASQDLMEKESELFQPLLDQAKKAIQDVAAENGFTYILDSQALLYESGTDILPLVKKKLGITASASKE